MTLSCKGEGIRKAECVAKCLYKQKTDFLFESLFSGNQFSDLEVSFQKPGFPSNGFLLETRFPI